MNNVVADVVGDSIHIVITQVVLAQILKDTMPVEINDSAALQDTIRLELDVSFESYSPTLSPQKKIGIKQDTLSIWYANYLPPVGTLY